MKNKIIFRDNLIFFSLSDDFGKIKFDDLKIEENIDASTEELLDTNINNIALNKEKKRFDNFIKKTSTKNNEDLMQVIKDSVENKENNTYLKLLDFDIDNEVGLDKNELSRYTTYLEGISKMILENKPVMTKIETKYTDLKEKNIAMQILVLHPELSKLFDTNLTLDAIQARASMIHKIKSSSGQKIVKSIVENSFQYRDLINILCTKEKPFDSNNKIEINSENSSLWEMATEWETKHISYKEFVARVTNDSSLLKKSQETEKVDLQTQKKEKKENLEIFLQGFEQMKPDKEYKNSLIKIHDLLANGKINDAEDKLSNFLREEVGIDKSGGGIASSKEEVVRALRVVGKESGDTSIAQKVALENIGESVSSLDEKIKTELKEKIKEAQKKVGKDAETMYEQTMEAIKGTPQELQMLKQGRKTCIKNMADTLALAKGVKSFIEDDSNSSWIEDWTDWNAEERAKKLGEIGGLYQDMSGAGLLTWSDNSGHIAKEVAIFAASMALTAGAGAIISTLGRGVQAVGVVVGTAGRGGKVMKGVSTVARAVRADKIVAGVGKGIEGLGAGISYLQNHKAFRIITDAGIFTISDHLLRGKGFETEVKQQEFLESLTRNFVMFAGFAGMNKLTGLIPVSSTAGKFIAGTTGDVAVIAGLTALENGTDSLDLDKIEDWESWAEIITMAVGFRLFMHHFPKLGEKIENKLRKSGKWDSFLRVKGPTKTKKPEAKTETKPEVRENTETKVKPETNTAVKRKTKQLESLEKGRKKSIEELREVQKEINETGGYRTAEQLENLKIKLEKTKLKIINKNKRISALRKDLSVKIEKSKNTETNKETLQETQKEIDVIIEKNKNLREEFKKGKAGEPRKKEIETELKKNNEKLEELRNKKTELKKELMTDREKMDLKRKKGEMENLKNENSKLQKEIDAKKSEIEGLENVSGTETYTRQKINELNGKVAKHKAKIKENSAKTEKLKTEIKNGSKETTQQQIREQNEQLRKEFKENMSEKTKTELKKNEIERKKIGEEKAELKKKLEKTEKKLEEAEKELEGTEATSSTEIKKLHNEIGKLKKQIKTKDKKLLESEKARNKILKKEYMDQATRQAKKAEKEKREKKQKEENKNKKEKEKKAEGNEKNKEVRKKAKEMLKKAMKGCKNPKEVLKKIKKNANLKDALKLAGLLTVVGGAIYATSELYDWIASYFDNPPETGPIPGPTPPPPPETPPPPPPETPPPETGPTPEQVQEKINEISIKFNKIDFELNKNSFEPYNRNADKLFDFLDNPLDGNKLDLRKFFGINESITKEEKGGKTRSWDTNIRGKKWVVEMQKKIHGEKYTNASGEQENYLKQEGNKCKDGSFDGMLGPLTVQGFKKYFEYLKSTDNFKKYIKKQISQK